MVLKAEKERIKTLISDTVTLLCKNGLNYKAQFSIEAVIGISLDESEEFYLSIKENVKQAQVVEKPNREPAEQSARRSPNRSPVLTPTKKRKHGLLANIKKEVHIKSTPPANFSNSRQANGSHVDQSTSDVIPNLSLGDIQENASEYWSSMTPGGGNDDNQEGGQEESVSVEGSQPPAKRQNRDSSNTSGDANQTDLQQQGDDDSMSHQADVISIKDEPDSDYDESDLQLQEHGGQLSLEGSTLQPVSTPSWMAGLPHSALQTSQGDPQQTEVRKQGRPTLIFRGLPATGRPARGGKNIMAYRGTLGRPKGKADASGFKGERGQGRVSRVYASPSLGPSPGSAVNAGTDGSPGEAGNLRGADNLGNATGGGGPVNNEAPTVRVDPQFDIRLAKGILLRKGMEVTPKEVYWNFSHSCRPAVNKIKEVMRVLCEWGVGSMEKVTSETSSKRRGTRTVFRKGEPRSVATALQMLNIDYYKYEQQYYKRADEDYYTSIQNMAEQLAGPMTSPMAEPMTSPITSPMALPQVYYDDGSIGGADG